MASKYTMLSRQVENSILVTLIDIMFGEKDTEQLNKVGRNVA